MAKYELAVKKKDTVATGNCFMNYFFFVNVNFLNIPFRYL